MHFDHMAPQVHFSGEHDKLLLDTSVVLAREVILHKVCFLRARLVDRRNGSAMATRTYQRPVVLEAG